MSILEEDAAFRELPYYKSIIKSFLRKQIRTLIEELAVETGEQSVIVMANTNTGTTSCIGSSNSKQFIEANKDIQTQFLSFCLSGSCGIETTKTGKRKPKNESKRTSKRAKHSSVPPQLENTMDDTNSQSVNSAEIETVASMATNVTSENMSSQPPSLILGVYPENEENGEISTTKSDNVSSKSESFEGVNIKVEPLSDETVTDFTRIKTEPEEQADTEEFQLNESADMSNLSGVPGDQSLDSSVMSSPGGTQTFGPIRFVPIRDQEKWRKRSSITMERKVQLIKDLEKGNVTQLELAKKYNIGRSTVSDILKKRHFYLEQSKSAFYNVRKRYRTVRFASDGGKSFTLNERMWKWFQGNMNDGIPMNGPIIQKKAQELARSLDIDNFKASNGWLARWRGRYNIESFKKWPITYTSQSTTE